MNEDPDEACVRCGELLPAPGLLEEVPPSAAVTPPDATQQVAAYQPPDAAWPEPPRLPRLGAVASPPPRPRRSAGWATAVIALLLLAGLAGVAYLAWARGLIALPAAVEARLPAPPRSIANGQLPGRPSTATGPASVTEQAASPEEEELFSGLKESREPRLRPLRRFSDDLRALQGRLVAIQLRPAPEGTDTAEREQQLADLQPIYADLLRQYNDFEDAAAKAQSPETEDTLTGLRSAFEARFGLYLDLLGRLYATDPQIEREEYVKADHLLQAISARGHIDVEALHTRWLAGAHARQQRELDARFADQYKALDARLATVRELRKQFNEAAEQLGPLNIDEGRITPQAQALLEMYDAYADKLEELWQDWKEFSPKLPPVSERPEGLAKAAQKYVDLVKSEHFDCFTQTYRIYALDKDLKHPAYQHLKDHYGFVQLEWPDKDGAYQAVFNQYEAEWLRNFRGERSGGGGGGGIDLGPGTPAPPTSPGMPPSNPPPANPPGGGGPPEPPVLPPSGG
jgi:hypothetical protein